MPNFIHHPLVGEEITEVEYMQYLGYLITSNGELDAHIENRIDTAYDVLAKLVEEGLQVTNTNARTISQLFKSIKRPTILYGIENVAIKKKIINRLKRCEGNILKRLMGVSYRCRSKDLTSALSIDTLELVLDKYKLKFFLRLCMNDLTNDIIKESFTSEDYDEIHAISYNVDRNMDESMDEKDTTIQHAILSIANINAHAKRNKKCPRSETDSRLREIFDLETTDNLLAEIEMIISYEDPSLY